MGNYVFSGCNLLEEIELPEGVNSFGLCVFGGCTSLKKVVIPASVTKLNTKMFGNCDALTTVIFKGDKCPEIVGDVFNKVPKDNLVFCINDNATGFDTNEVVAKSAGHIFKTTNKAATSCIDPAKEIYTCILHSDCEKNYVITKDALNHVAGKAVRENILNATMKRAGKYDSVVYCSVCKKELSRTTKTTKKITVSRSSIKRLKRKGKNSITLTINRAKSVSGYEIVYSSNRSFAGKKLKVIKNAKMSKVTISKLQKKTYYVRIRSYKKVNGKIYRSVWSKVKKIRR